MLYRLKYALAAGLLLALAPAAEADTPADTLVIAHNIDDIITLDPAEAYELTGIEVVANVYDRIMRFEPEDISKLAGGVAESYTVSDDGKTLTFKIRPGLKFTSGNPLTAADAAFSLQRVVKLDKTPAFLIQLARIFLDQNPREAVNCANRSPHVVGNRISETFQFFGALAQFTEQPRILHSDNRLCREVLKKSDLLIHES